MKKNLVALVLGVGFSFLATPSFATDILVADGSSSGTYQAMLKQLNQMSCGALKMVEVPDTHGAVDNLDKLVDNEAQLAFMHSDVIQFRANNEDPDFKDKFKTLLALYPEDVHFLVLNKPYKSGGHELMGHVIGGNDVQLNTINDLANLPVGAAGGGYITIQYVRLQAEIPYVVTKFDTGADVMDALNKGTIACAVFVGAAPLPNLKDLGNDYKLLSVGDASATKLKSLYKQTTITYPKMATEPIHTIAPECLLVARVYKTPKFVNELREFRNCFNINLDEIKETPGTHKAWQKVEANNRGKWEYYDFNK